MPVLIHPVHRLRYNIILLQHFSSCLLSALAIAAMTFRAVLPLLIMTTLVRTSAYTLLLSPQGCCYRGSAASSVSRLETSRKAILCRMLPTTCVQLYTYVSCSVGRLTSVSRCCIWSGLVLHSRHAQLRVSLKRFPYRS